MKSVLLSCVACICSVGVVMAQTTLSGDHVITGDLSVGNTGTPGNLEVTGESGNTSAPGIKVTGDGGVVFEGNYGTGQIPATGTGTRFMWYPKKGALRAGTVIGNSWDDSNIGPESVAFGIDCMASGANSMAIGSSCRAFGEASLAVGCYAGTTGTYSLAVGWDAYAYDSCAISVGEMVYARGGCSGVIGSWSSVYGYASFASGYTNEVSGNYSMAAGINAMVFSDCSVGMGKDIVANSFCSLVIGQNNKGGGNPTSWNVEDSIFEIGNGTGNPADPVAVRNRNALTVYKNGNIEMTAKVKMPRQGDILMGEFGNPE